MKVDVINLLFGYLLIFTGVILFAWLLFNLRMQRQRAKERRWLECRVCGETFKDRDAVFSVRCPCCGAKNRKPFLFASAPGKKGRPQKT